MTLMWDVDTLLGNKRLGHLPGHKTLPLSQINKRSIYCLPYVQGRDRKESRTHCLGSALSWAPALRQDSHIPPRKEQIRSWKGSPGPRAGLFWQTALEMQTWPKPLPWTDGTARSAAWSETTSAHEAPGQDVHTLPPTHQLLPRNQGRESLHRQESVPSRTTTEHVPNTDQHSNPLFFLGTQEDTENVADHPPATVLRA